MDDIDDLFAGPLPDGLNDDTLPDGLANGLNGQLNGALANGLHDGLDGELNADLSGHINGEAQGALEEQLAIPPAVPPPGLALRLDRLHTGGCNQSLAWSRLGALAYIDKDLKAIKIRCLKFQPDGEWGFSDYTEPLLVEKLSVLHQDADCAHVAWSPFGGDLLVIDSCGRIAVCFMWFALNRLMISKLLNYDSEGNLNAVVAIKWLAQVKKAVAIPGTATKTSGQWKYHLSGAEPRGPFSPNHKTGFLIVTRGSLLKLYLQGANNGDWLEVKHELGGVSTSYELISHATMSSEKSHAKKDDEILLTIYTITGRLKLYTVRIDWQASPDSPNAGASIRVQHVTQINRCLPSSNPSIMSGLSTEDPQLCHLTLIPRILTQPGQTNTTSPVILAAFSLMDPSGLMVTTISRWEVVESTPTVDPSFSQLSTKKATPGHLPDERALKPLEDICLDRLVIGVELIQHDTQIVLHYSNGDTEFRDRDMAEMPLELATDRVASFHRIGFAFSRGEPCLEVALSPHSTVKVSMNKNHEHKLFSMQLPLPIVDSELVSQVAAVFVLQHAASESISSNPADDLLMTMWDFEKQLAEHQRTEMESQFMKDLYTILQVTDKCTEGNPDVLIKLPALGKTISMQAALNVRTHTNRGISRLRPGKIALTLQSLRVVASSLSYSCATLPKGQEMDLHRPEILDYLTPLVKWFIQLVDYILNELFQANRVMGVTDPFDGDALAAKVESAYACLILIMGTATRTCLRYIIRAINTLPSILRSGMSQAQSPLSVKYTALSAALRGGLTTPKHLDQILELMEQALNRFYAGLRPGERQDIEMQLLAEGKIPIILNSYVHKLLTQPIEQMRTQTSEIEELLAFRQWGPVSLADDKQTAKWEAETTWDASRKVDLTGKKVRKKTCLRCTSITEDVAPIKERVQRTWLANMMRSCFCGGQLVLDKPV